jgi:hypothetical protein
MCYMHDRPGWQDSVLRLVDVFVDGLRVQGKLDGPTRSASHRGAAEGIKRKPRHGSARRLK